MNDALMVYTLAHTLVGLIDHISTVLFSVLKILTYLTILLPYGSLLGSRASSTCYRSPSVSER